MQSQWLHFLFITDIYIINKQYKTMGKYLKKFDNHTQYEEARKNLILSNVSLCVQENEVHYNPWVETRVVAKFNVTSTSSATPIMNSSATSQFSEIEVDGVVQPSVVSSYTFSTTGEHIIKYTLIDDTIIGMYVFRGCEGLTSIIIPDSVTVIYDGAFSGCTSLTSLTIGNSVSNIQQYAFAYCSNLTSLIIPDSVSSIREAVLKNCNSLTSIISLATTAPKIQSSTFSNVKTGGTLTVPAGSTGYDVWMGTGNYYLGKYNWTKVEQ